MSRIGIQKNFIFSKIATFSFIIHIVNIHQFVDVLKLCMCVPWIYHIFFNCQIIPLNIKEMFNICNSSHFFSQSSHNTRGASFFFSFLFVWKTFEGKIFMKMIKTAEHTPNKKKKKKKRSKNKKTLVFTKLKCKSLFSMFNAFPFSNYIISFSLFLIL